MSLIKDVYGPSFDTAAPSCRWVQQTIPTAPLEPYYSIGGGTEASDRCPATFAAVPSPEIPWATAMPGAESMQGCHPFDGSSRNGMAYQTGAYASNVGPGNVGKGL